MTAPHGLAAYVAGYRNKNVDLIPNVDPLVQHRVSDIVATFSKSIGMTLQAEWLPRDAVGGSTNHVFFLRDPSGDTRYALRMARVPTSNYGGIGLINERRIWSTIPPAIFHRTIVAEGVQDDHRYQIQKFSGHQTLGNVFRDLDTSTQAKAISDVFNILRQLHQVKPEGKWNRHPISPTVPNIKSWQHYVDDIELGEANIANVCESLKGWSRKKLPLLKLWGILCEDSGFNNRDEEFEPISPVHGDAHLNSFDWDSVIKRVTGTFDLELSFFSKLGRRSLDDFDVLRSIDFVRDYDRTPLSNEMIDVLRPYLLGPSNFPGAVLNRYRFYEVARTIYRLNRLVGGELQEHSGQVRGFSATLLGEHVEGNDFFSTLARDSRVYAESLTRRPVNYVHEAFGIPETFGNS